MEGDRGAGPPPPRPGRNGRGTCRSPIPIGPATCSRPDHDRQAATQTLWRLGRYRGAARRRLRGVVRGAGVRDGGPAGRTSWSRCASPSSSVSSSHVLDPLRRPSGIGPRYHGPRRQGGDAHRSPSRDLGRALSGLVVFTRGLDRRDLCSWWRAKRADRHPRSFFGFFPR